MQTNAALSGEQRQPPYLNHCDINTKPKESRKRQALGVRLKRFVSHIFANHSLFEIEHIAWLV
ncbi:hypothetical protein D0D73_25170 [Vibrio parahaemolyticus]|nr:hypothetical protein [Vibrio parahaemolyticus]EGR1762976.1 hypothetical protein [Vibrio parahaemolyticus]